MDRILAFHPGLSTLFRQRVTTLPLQTPSSIFDPSRLTNHLATDHPNQPLVSSALISEAILSGQKAKGFNSDRVRGRFLGDFTPQAPIKGLNYPTVGAAWNFFENKITSFFLVASSVPLRFLSPTGKAFVSLNYGSSFPNQTLTPVESLEFGKLGQKYRVVQPTQFNTGGVITAPQLLTQGFVQIRPNVFEADIKDVPNFGVANTLINSSLFATVREFTLSSDIFPPGEVGFFNEAEFTANPLIPSVVDHINTYPHHGIRDEILSNTTCMSTFWLQGRYTNNVQQQGYGGDTWFNGDGSNNSHPIEPVLPGTVIYWVAYYNGEESGKRVRHPNGSILAAPVNGKKRIRCAFTLPVELTPLADQGVVLRRCNPTLGYRPGLA
jgi:hypothetical protein